MPKLLIKICGLKTPEGVECAVEAGVDMLGFNFHPKSPRHVSLETARNLASIAQGRVQRVGLVVDVDEEQARDLVSAVDLDWLQLHGAESLEQVEAIRAVVNRPVMKALGIAGPDDLPPVVRHAAVSNLILLDAKPPKNAAYPGGHGKVFDWEILSTLPPDMPFMLSGGLTPENVAGAIRIVRNMGLNLAGVDVSSGVESAPGVKDLGRIRAFVAAARAVEQDSMIQEPADGK
jgi:phosphoribosylanthranilate isomerase